MTSMELMEAEQMKVEIEEYEMENDATEEDVELSNSGEKERLLARQRNSRRKAATKNADFEEKKAAKKEARIEKNSDVHGHCPMKGKYVSYFKTARRRSERRKANKLVSDQ